MPHRVRDTEKHHHRRYSWPPSLHLVDISTIHVPLPDIHEDPFSHFISSVPEEDDEIHLDALASSAGIFTSQPAASANKEKAYKFRTSIARKWAKFMGKRCAVMTAWSHSDVEVLETKPLGVTDGAERYYGTVSGMGTLPNRPSPHSLKSSRNGKPVRNKWARHSWHAPAYDLYTIKEEVEPAS
jgi:hypothetical protein